MDSMRGFSYFAPNSQILDKKLVILDKKVFKKNLLYFSGCAKKIIIMKNEWKLRNLKNKLQGEQINRKIENFEKKKK